MSPSRARKVCLKRILCLGFSRLKNASRLKGHPFLPTILPNRRHLENWDRILLLICSVGTITQ